MDGGSGDRAHDGMDGIEALGGSASAAPRTGHLEGVDDEGRLLFRPEGHIGAAVPVAIGVTLGDELLLQAAREGRRAVVVATSDPGLRYVLVGLVRDRLRSAAVARAGLDARVDGEAVRIEGADRIELVCGKASIVLEADGHVTISGTHVVSSSRGPNKIKGATVTLN
jgi:hypothetical protein